MVTLVAIPKSALDPEELVSLKGALLVSSCEDEGVFVALLTLELVCAPLTVVVTSEVVSGCDAL